MAFATDTSASVESSHPLYISNTGNSLLPGHQLIEVSLARRGGASEHIRCCLVGMLHATVGYSAEAHLAETGRQFILPAGIVKLEPGRLLGTYFGPLLRVPIE